MTFFSALVPGTLILLLGLLVLVPLRAQPAALRHWLLTAALLCATLSPLLRELAPEWVSFGAARVLSTSVAPITHPLHVAAVAPARESRVAGRSGPPHGYVTWPQMLLLLWAAGTCGWLAWLAIGVWRLRRITREATLVTSGPWREAVATLQRAHGLTMAIDVRVMDRAAMPLVWGARRPTILIPRRALAWPGERIAVVAAHEMAHIRRHDWALQIASELSRACYWCHPLAWIACARLRVEADAACDDLVLADGTDAPRYAAHLIDIAREFNTRVPVPAPAVVRASTLERRLQAMLDPTRDRRPISLRLRAVSLAAVLSLAVLIAGGAAQSFVSVTGTLVDPTRSVLPNVTLRLTNELTGAKYEIRSDRAGRYEFVGLPPGEYALDADLPGFSRYNARVTVGSQNVQQDVVMAIGTLQETVTVTDGADVRTPDPERTRRIEEMRAKRAAVSCPEAPIAGGVRMGGNLRVPVKYRDVRPAYPAALRGTTGVVLLSARIAPDGSVADVDVVETTHAGFAQAAIDAVRQWEFDATLLNCERVATPMQITVNFRAQ